MQALNRLRTRLFKQQRMPDPPPGIPPLYQRKPPLWAQWTYALLGCDIFMTGSIVELTWNHWTEPADATSKNEKIQHNGSSDATSSGFVLRPVWQRLGLSVFHLAVGVGAAVALVGSQTRVVRTICILRHLSPTKSFEKDPREVFIQCAHHWKYRGRVFPISRCRLDPGRDDSEIILRVDGERGHWWIGLNKAKINGKDLSLAASRAAILGEWKQQKNTGWKSGPILR